MENLFNNLLLISAVFVLPIIIGMYSRLAAFIYAKAWIIYAITLLYEKNQDITYAAIAFIGLEIFIPIGNQILEKLD